MGMFPKNRGENGGKNPQNGMGKIMENPYKNGMIWGNPLFLETPIIFFVVEELGF